MVRCSTFWIKWEMVPDAIFISFTLAFICKIKGMFKCCTLLQPNFVPVGCSPLAYKLTDTFLKLWPSGSVIWKLKFGCHAWVNFFCRSIIGKYWMLARQPCPMMWPSAWKTAKASFQWWQPVRWDMRTCPVWCHCSLQCDWPWDSFTSLWTLSVTLSLSLSHTHTHT